MSRNKFKSFTKLKQIYYRVFNYKRLVLLEELLSENVECSDELVLKRVTLII